VKSVKLPYIRIVEYRSREPVTTNVTSMLYSLLHEVGTTQDPRDSLMEKDAYKAYTAEQFLGGDPWRPIPPDEHLVKTIENAKETERLGYLADIGNGMVSGLDEAFRLSSEEFDELNDAEKNATIRVYKAATLDRFYPRSIAVPYAFTNNIRSERILRKDYPHFHRKLAPYQSRLRHRYDYSRYIPWWHWVFLRNKSLFERHREKILVPSKERYNTRGYFRFALISDNEKPSYITQDVTAVCLRERIPEGTEYVVGILNSESVQRWMLIKGFSRGGVHDFSEHPLSVIPIPRVNWNNLVEAEAHRLIVDIVKDNIRNRRISRLPELDEQVEHIINSKKEGSSKKEASGHLLARPSS
jgi:adenine-specific DNA-methyltransferase